VTDHKFAIESTPKERRSVDQETLRWKRIAGRDRHGEGHLGKIGLFMSCAMGAALFTTGCAHAAAADAKAANTSQSGTAVGEVVVTAVKSDANIQKVTEAISAYSSDKRDQIGIDSVQDMTNFTPGFTYNTGDDRVTLRGIGRYTNQLSSDSSVAVYEDGGFETFTVKAGNDSIFVDRIEVLRGPQGTLYGRASIGGAVNIISRRPTTAWYGEVRAGVDNYGAHFEEGAVSGPINDDLQFRLAASKTDQAKGYYNNLSGGPSEGQVRDEWYLEGQIQGKVGSKFDFWLKVFGSEWNDLGGQAGGRITNQRIVGPDGVTPVANPSFSLLTGNGGGGETLDPLVPALGAYAATGVTDVVTTNPSGLDPANANLRNIYSTYPQQVKLHAYYGGILQMNYHLDGVDIKYIGSAQHYAYYTREEYGENDQLATGVISYNDPKGNTIFPNSLLYYGEEHYFQTNEINIVSTSTSKFQWVVGFYNFNESYFQPEAISLYQQASIANPIYFSGAPAPPNPDRDVYYAAARAGAETFAGFAHSDWEFAKDWKLTTGIRYSWDAKYGLDQERIILLGPLFGLPNIGFDATGVTAAEPGATAATIDPATGIATRKLGASWGGVTAAAGIQWEPDADTNAYFKYNRGEKSGGFNAGSGLIADVETKPETSNDFQFGVKRKFFNSLQVNLDLFYDQYYNAQIQVGAVTGAGNVATTLLNIPEARSDGVEVEAVWQPNRALQVIFSYGYDDTKIINSGCIVDTYADPTASYLGATPGNCPVLANGDRGQNLAGGELPNAPANKLALNGNYTFFLQPGSLSLSATYAWRDQQYGSLFNRPFNLAPSWDQVDLRAEFRSANGKYSIIAYGKNIFNTAGYQGGRIGVRQASGDYVIEDVLNPPALYGIELQYRF
jgi:iron complex outermembrane receptor protein